MEGPQTGKSSAATVLHPTGSLNQSDKNIQLRTSRLFEQHSIIKNKGFRPWQQVVEAIKVLEKYLLANHNGKIMRLMNAAVH